MHKTVLIITLLFSVFACNNDSATKKQDPEQLALSIQELGKKMFDETTSKMNTQIATEYIEKASTFAKENPGDDRSPVFLTKSAEVARSIKAFDKALTIYQWIYDKFPNSKQAPQALFLKAFTLDNELHKQDAAKKIYEEFLKKYPNDDFADDTQFLLDNLGKSEEELIKEFEAKQKE